MNSVAIAAIDTLCVDISHAVKKADWAAVTSLLSRRQRQLEALFDTPTDDAQLVKALRQLSERVMTCDREQLPKIIAARGDTAEELRALQIGRRATAAYRHHSG